MGRRNAVVVALALLTVVFCLTPGPLQTTSAGTKETAQAIASSVDDAARTLEGRQAAIQKLREACSLFISAGETIDAARTLNRIGRVQLLLYKPQEAIASHTEALSLLERAPDHEAEVNALNGKGAAYLLLKQKDRVNEVLQKSLTLSEAQGLVAGQAQALLTLSELQNLNDHQLGLETGKRALELWKSIGDKAGSARTHLQIGICYMAQNALMESAASFQQALALWRELRNQTEEAEALIMLGYVEHRNAEWQNSISYMMQAQGLLDQNAEPRKMGQIATALAEAFNENGLPEIGITQYQRAGEYFQQTQDPRSANYVELGLGWTHYLMGNFPEALAHLQRSMSGTDPESLDAAPRYEYLGRVYIAMGEEEEALRHLGLALAIYLRSSNPKEAAQVRALMGQAYQRQGKPEKATELYVSALDTFHTLSDRANESATLYALGTLELSLNNLDAAETHLRQSIDITESIRRVRGTSDLATAFSATVHDRYETYIECLMRKHRAQPNTGHETRAFEISEQGRGRVLSELLRATQTNLIPDLDPQLAIREKSLRQTLRIKEDYKIALLSGPYKKEELDSLEAEVARLESDYKNVNEAISARYPSYEQINHPSAWGLRNIQEQVIADEDTVVLEFTLGADRSYVWVVSRNDISSHELPPASQIVKVVQQAHRLLATKPSSKANSELDSALQSLGDLLLSPVASRLRKRVIIVADGALNYIPFQTLSATGAGGETLVANHEVINALSASILGQLRQEIGRRKSPSKLLAAFGDPVFPLNYAQAKSVDAGEAVAMWQSNEDRAWHGALRDIELNGDRFDPSVIKPLFYAKRELANLREATSGGEMFLASDFTATRENLLNTDLTPYAILHFATHGFLDPKRPENSGLVLSTVDRDGKNLNGFVGLQDIYQLRAPVDLVVLSACQTGLGKDVRGEGLLGLTRGFMYAGASSVVASLWKVDDEATAELMKEFYGNLLQKGMAPGAALREAQNTIRQKPEWSSPYFWAAFTLQGEYRQVIKPAGGRPSYLKFVVVGVLLLSAIAGALYVRRYRLRKG